MAFIAVKQGEITEGKNREKKRGFKLSSPGERASKGDQEGRVNVIGVKPGESGENTKTKTRKDGVSGGSGPPLNATVRPRK